MTKYGSLDSGMGSMPSHGSIVNDTGLESGIGIPVPDINEGKEYHVYFAYGVSDDLGYSCINEIFECLEKQGFRCCNADTFEPGATVISNITTSIAKSEQTIVFVPRCPTDDSLLYLFERDLVIWTWSGSEGRHNVTVVKMEKCDIPESLQIFPAIELNQKGAFQLLRNTLLERKWTHVPPGAYMLKYGDSKTICSNPPCKHICKFNDIGKHNDECPFRIISCPNANCNREMFEFKLKPHELRCEWKIVPCCYSKYGCTETMPRIHLLKHKTDCIYRIVRCQNFRCWDKMFFHELRAHIDNACNYTKMACRNGNCEEALYRKDLQSHMDFTCKYRTIECIYPECKYLVVVDQIFQHRQKCLFRRCRCPCGYKCLYIDLGKHQYENDCKNWENNLTSLYNSAEENPQCGQNEGSKLGERPKHEFRSVPGYFEVDSTSKYISKSHSESRLWSTHDSTIELEKCFNVSPKSRCATTKSEEKPSTTPSSEFEPNIAPRPEKELNISPKPEDGPTTASESKQKLDIQYYEFESNRASSVDRGYKSDEDTVINPAPVYVTSTTKPSIKYSKRRLPNRSISIGHADEDDHPLCHDVCSKRFDNETDLNNKRHSDNVEFRSRDTLSDKGLAVLFL
ncbi:unnamed protein product [Owenia fusiformis]|uniref:TRAF-type domain-containing protein n=1 Tax=Owenia fusiformis TaxID=6347 RepID=A0A8S4PX65_OWEFU|nr:unnamed protein product [Owenia fusiformis]